MTTVPNRKMLSEELVVRALIAIGEDPSAHRVSEVQRAVDGSALPAEPGDALLIRAVDAARQLLRATAMSERTLFGSTDTHATHKTVYGLSLQDRDAILRRGVEDNQRYAGTRQLATPHEVRAALVQTGDIGDLWLASALTVRIPSERMQNIAPRDLAVRHGVDEARAILMPGGVLDFIEVMKECVTIRQGDHPYWGGDRVLNADVFLHCVAQNSPARALALAADLSDKVAGYSDAIGVSPDRVGYFAKRLHEAANRALGRTAAVRRDVESSSLVI